MVSIEIISGTQKGEVLFSSEIKSPHAVFEHLLQSGAQWRINLAMASHIERAVWGSCDVLSRCARAAVNRRKIIINKKELPIDCKKDFIEELKKIEEELINLCHKGWIRVIDDNVGNLMIFSVMPPRNYN